MHVYLRVFNVFACAVPFVHLLLNLVLSCSFTGLKTHATDTLVQTSKASESLISKLLLQSIDEITSNHVQMDRFYAIFERVMSGRSPFSVNLSSLELVPYTKIAHVLAQSIVTRTGVTAYANSSEKLMEHQTRENLVRFWLGVGDLAGVLKAVNFLLTESYIAKGDLSRVLPLAIGPFLEEYQSLASNAKRRMIQSKLSAVHICTLVLPSGLHCNSHECMPHSQPERTLYRITRVLSKS